MTNIHGDNLARMKFAEIYGSRDYSEVGAIHGQGEIVRTFNYASHGLAYNGFPRLERCKVTSRQEYE